MVTDFLTLFDHPLLALAAALGAVMGALTLNALILVWMERKVSARMQRRIGPTEVGPAGLLQTSADIVKLISKQLIVPRHVDKVFFLLAPLVVFVPAIAAASLIPISEDWVVQNLGAGLVFVFALGGMAVIGVFMAGWGSNNKYALIGAIRSVAQNISYEIPLILSALSVVLMCNSLNLYEIAAAQDTVWYIVMQPVAAIIFLIAGTAETNRAPFDIPEAESELVAGFHTEYSGMGFAMFFFAEYSNMAVVSAVATVLFLGGWSGPWLPGPVWFLLKVYFLIFVMMWFRWTFPRLRFDQLMTFCWTVLVPLSIANLLVTALCIKLVGA